MYQSQHHDVDGLDYGQAEEDDLLSGNHGEEPKVEFEKSLDELVHEERGQKRQGYKKQFTSSFQGGQQQPISQRSD